METPTDKRSCSERACIRMTRQEHYYRKIAKRLPEYAKAAQKTYIWARQNSSQGEAEQITASYCIAPTIYAYVEWLLADAIQRGIKRLYFLARDGYQMLEVAHVIKEQRNYSIELRYLYCSRYALQLPVYHLDENYLDYICTGGKELRLKQVLERGGLTEPEVDIVLQEQGKEGDILLTYQEVRALKDTLQRSSYFNDMVLCHSKEAYETCMAYLQQEGLLDSVVYGIVDSGWIGTMQATLQKLLRSAGYVREIEGYYFGLYEIPAHMNEDRYHTFYFNPQGDYRRKIWFNNNLFEVIFSAPEGMTLGYQKDGNEYKPMFRTSKGDTRLIEQQLQLIRQFARELYIQSKDIQNVVALKKRLSGGIVWILKAFMTYPSREEAEVYGNIEFTDYMLDTGMTVLAEPMTREQLNVNHLFNRYWQMRKGSYVPTSFWLMGSLNRSQGNRLELGWHRFWILTYYYATYVKKDLNQIKNRKKFGVIQHE